MSILVSCHFFTLLTEVFVERDVTFLDSFYLVNVHILHTCTIFILILAACGWLYDLFSRKIYFFALLGLVVILNILAEILAYKNREATSNVHLYEGNAGKIVLSIEISNVLIFMLGFLYSKEDKNETLKGYMQRLWRSGGVLLLTNLLALMITRMCCGFQMYGIIIPFLKDMIYFGTFAYLFLQHSSNPSKIEPKL